MPNPASGLLAGLADLVWPRSCSVCDGPIARSPSPCLCETCRDEVFAEPEPACPRCASTVGPHVDLSNGCTDCRGKGFRFVGAIRVGEYAGRLRDAVLRLKQEAGEPLAEELGRAWAAARAAQLAAHAPAAVVPIPLHWRRRWVRGYNQSEAVARGLAAGLGLPCRPGWLVRTRATPSQRARSAAERRENVRGAFRVPARAARGVEGVAVRLVDDVMTTGATADAAAAALREAGAAQVSLGVLAHG